MVKANYKQLKAVLAKGVRKLGINFLVLNLCKFPLFDSFLNLASFLPSEFWDLDNFWPFNFLDFLAISSSPLLISNSLSSPLLTFSRLEI